MHQHIAISVCVCVIKVNAALMSAIIKLVCREVPANEHTNDRVASFA